MFMYTCVACVLHTIYLIFPLHTIYLKKVVVVCGASQGIGSEIAFRYAKHGAKLVLAARNEGKLARVADDARSRGSPKVGDRLISALPPTGLVLLMTLTVARFPKGFYAGRRLVHATGGGESRELRQR
jgi:NAD(P)-dependent dehydrogenase (short-subunit alcohol dehydrogenase family)